MDDSAFFASLCKSSLLSTWWLVCHQGLHSYFGLSKIIVVPIQEPRLLLFGLTSHGSEKKMREVLDSCASFGSQRIFISF